LRSSVPFPQFDSDYVLEDLGDQLVPMYHVEGTVDPATRKFEVVSKKRVFVRHPLNDREQKATEDKYVKLFLKHGLVKDGRSGRPVCVPDTLDKKKWTLSQMGAATFFAALYRCMEQHAENDYVKHFVSMGGVTGVVILNPRTPTDALKWIRDQGNKCVGLGSAKSFMEIMKEIPTIEKEWIAHRNAKKMDKDKDNDAEAEGDEAATPEGPATGSGSSSSI